MLSDNKGRSPNLDIIRVFALLTVVCVHFFIHTGYLSQPVNSPRMYVMTIMRTFFMICVPLFIMLSGYLMKNKTLSRKYYLGIVKTLGIYLLASIVNYLYRVLYKCEDISILSMGTGILDFTLAPYAWYVELYIGLFMIIPFLNLIYNNLECKKHKAVLILTMIMLTAAPSVVNAWNFTSPGFFVTPSSSDHYVNLIPDWWSGIYPVTYYFIGCWLREYGLGISRRKNFFLLVASVLFWGLFNIYRSYPSTFVAGAWQDWGALPNVINAALVFNLLLNISEKAVPRKAHKPLKLLSDLTFGAYLMSWVFDDFFYIKLGTFVTDVTVKLNWFPVIIPLSFICAYAASLVINIVYKFLYATLSKIFFKA